MIVANNNSAFGTGTLAFNAGRLLSSGYLTTLANNVTIGGNVTFGSTTQLQSLVFSSATNTFGLGGTQRTLTTVSDGVAEVIIADQMTGTAGFLKSGGRLFASSNALSFVQGNLVLDRERVRRPPTRATS